MKNRRDKRRREICRKYVVGSMDMKSLYPSLDIGHTIEVVCEMFKSSETNLEEIDINEVGLYLALSMSQEEINRAGIADYCPKRR